MKQLAKIADFMTNVNIAHLASFSFLSFCFFFSVIALKLAQTLKY